MTAASSGQNSEQHRDEKLALLAALPFFEGVPEAILAKLAAVGRERSWPAGLSLFQRGDASSYLIAMEQGHIKISLQAASGSEFVLQHVRGRAIVGEVGVLDGSTRTADATVVAPTTGISIERGDYRRLQQQHHELADAAIRHLCQLVRYTTDHIETIALYDLRARLARFLLNASGDAGADSAVLLDLNQSEIAGLLGASRPKLNRALADLERLGAIVREGRALKINRGTLGLLGAASDS